MRRYFFIHQALRPLKSSVQGPCNRAYRVDQSLKSSSQFINALGSDKDINEAKRLGTPKAFRDHYHYNLFFRSGMLNSPFFPSISLGSCTSHPLSSLAFGRSYHSLARSMADAKSMTHGFDSPSSFQNEELFSFPSLSSPCAASPLELDFIQNAIYTTVKGYEILHVLADLSWCYTIPLVTLCMRLLLLPLSLRQARIIRSNYGIYKEAVVLTDLQIKRKEREALANAAAEALPTGNVPVAYIGVSTNGSLAGPVRGDVDGERKECEPNTISNNSTLNNNSNSDNHSNNSSSALKGTRILNLDEDFRSTTTSTTTTPILPLSSSSNPSSSSSSNPSPPNAPPPPSVLERMQRSQQLLINFHTLRQKMDAPHPLWIVINPFLQIPVFILISGALNAMCRGHWPGMSHEGMLWFPDLTQAAYDWNTGEMPLGPLGFVLPFAIYALTMTSLRIGIGASGLRVMNAMKGDALMGEQTAMGSLLRSLPTLLYISTTLGLYFKVQMPYGVLEHWMTSAIFTLTLQGAMRQPAVRAFLKLPGSGPYNDVVRQSEAEAAGGGGGGNGRGDIGETRTPASTVVMSERDVNISNSNISNGTSLSSDPKEAKRVGGFKLPTPPTVAQAAAAVRGGGGGGDGGDMANDILGFESDLGSSVSAAVRERVSETTDPDVLVIMGAQYSARRQYAEAMYCLEAALDRDPLNVRGHYSVGQLFSLRGQWAAAAASFRRSESLAPPGREKGQAMYCVATSLQNLGELEEAATAYRQALLMWPNQVVIHFSLASCLYRLSMAHAHAAAMAGGDSSVALDLESNNDLKDGRVGGAIPEATRKDPATAAAAAAKGARTHAEAFEALLEAERLNLLMPMQPFALPLADLRKRILAAMADPPK